MLVGGGGCKLLFVLIVLTGTFVEVRFVEPDAVRNESSGVGLELTLLKSEGSARVPDRMSRIARMIIAANAKARMPMRKDLVPLLDVAIAGKEEEVNDAVSSSPERTEVELLGGGVVVKRTAVS
jgi:hypothetical protein